MQNYVNGYRMRLIAITAERIFEGEAAALNRLLERGLTTLHLRKPLAAEADIRQLLEQIDRRYHSRIVLHDGFSLAGAFCVGGVHLSRRNPVRPQPAAGSLSRSCHSLNEVAQSGDFCYVFLSPIFDSISKKGYAQAFTEKELMAAKAKGVINEKVVALGGVSAATIPLAAAYGFGGVAVLGALWGDYPQSKDESALMRRFDAIAKVVK